MNDFQATMLCIFVVIPAFLAGILILGHIWGRPAPEQCTALKKERDQFEDRSVAALSDFLEQLELPILEEEKKRKEVALQLHTVLIGKSWQQRSQD